jgi:tocopherol cyclase
MSIKTILSPGTYHGSNAKPPFFEGWYYKMVSADESHKVAIIPGVILGQDAHAFVQILDGVNGISTYHKFPIERFQADTPHFTFEIGKNYFTGSFISLAIDRPEGSLNGEINLGPLHPWPVTLLSPGIMGWYAWVPRLECYHGLLSFDHTLHGNLTRNGKWMNFTGGHGYIEKDWGQAFPAAWI